MIINSRPRIVAVAAACAGTLLFGLAGPAAAEPLRPVDDHGLHGVVSSLPDQHVTSAQVTVAGDTRRTITGGVADVRTGAATRPASRVRIGSATKMFTAALALRLVAQHRMSLTTPVRHYLPWLPRAWSAVTVHQLLEHTSGRPDHHR